MPLPSETIQPTHGFDPTLFWDLHRNKIIAGGVALIIALIGFAIYEALAQKTRLESQDAFARAHTEEDYRALIARFSNTDAAGNARLLLAGLLRDAKKFDESDAQLNDFIARFPDHPLIGGGYLSLAMNRELEGKTDEALEKYKEIETKYTDSYASPIAMLAEGDLLRSLGRMDEARTTYQNINAQYPDSLFSQEALRELVFSRMPQGSKVPVKSGTDLITPPR